MKNLALTETHRLPASWTRNSASPPAMNPRLLTFRVLTRGCFPAKKHPAIFMWRQGATEKSRRAASAGFRQLPAPAQPGAAVFPWPG